MEQLKPYLEKLSFLFDHVEKIILVGALGFLAYVSYNQLFFLEAEKQKLEKATPTKAKNPYETGGETVGKVNISPLHAALSAARNTNEAPQVSFQGHQVFHPEEWMHNKSQGIFPADDGPNRRTGVKALTMDGAPRIGYLQIRPEIRIQTLPNGEQRIQGIYISVRDTSLRYQTRDANLFNNPELHPFLPCTNVILFTTNKQGQAELKVSPKSLENFVQRSQVEAAGLVNKLCLHEYAQTASVDQPDDRVMHIIKHQNPLTLRRLVKERISGVGPIGADPAKDPWRHPERIIVKYNSHKIETDGAYWVDLELWLYDSSRANPNSFVYLFKGRNRLRSFQLGPNDQVNSNVGWKQYPLIPRFNYVNLQYKTPGKTLLFEGCQEGRKLFIEGRVWVVDKIHTDSVVLLSDPAYDPAGQQQRVTIYPAGRGPSAVAGR